MVSSLGVFNSSDEQTDKEWSGLVLSEVRIDTIDFAKRVKKKLDLHLQSAVQRCGTLLVLVSYYGFGRRFREIKWVKWFGEKLEKVLIFPKINSSKNNSEDYRRFHVSNWIY